MGRKVSLRYALNDPAHPFSEAVGVVMSVTSAKVTVVTRRGDQRIVPVADIVVAKVWPH